MTELRNKNRQPIEVRFVADGLVPESVLPHELADMLEAIENLIVKSVQAERPDLDKDAIGLGLRALESNSIGFGFISSPEPVVVPIFRSVARAIAAQTYGRLARGARDAVNKIAAFTRRHHCIAELRTSDGQTIELLATINAEVDIAPAARVTGLTTIYGRVINAGGKEPNAHLELADGGRVICRGSAIQVKQLASRLYSTVGVEGKAWWDSETFEILDFEIANITPYEDTPLEEVMRDLRQAAGSHFDGIDALHYVHELRSDEAEG